MGASRGVIVVAALRTELLFVRGPKAALGVGPRATETLRALLARGKPAGLVIVGYAGGLQPELRPGTLVLAERVRDAQGEVPLEGELVRRAARLLPEARVGPLFTDTKLTPKEEKAALAEKALAVDMETSLLARELRAQGIPFLAARVILDALEEEAAAGLRGLLWAGRALRGSWILGRAAQILRDVLTEALCAA